MKVVSGVCLSLLLFTAGASGAGEKKEPKVGVGMMAPDLPLEGIKNHASLATFRGRPVLLHIWASWCGPCKVSMPIFQSIGESFKKTDLVVLMVDRDHSPVEAHMYLIQQHILWPDYHDEHGRFLRTFGRGSIPATVLIDRDGVVQYHHFGEGLSDKTRQNLFDAVARAVRTPASAAAPAADAAQ